MMTQSDPDPLLPNLLVAGVTKAGTTSLFAYLAQHPEICASSEKDINYFSPLRRGQSQRGPLSIHDRFFAHCSDQPYRLDASPDYFNGGPEVVSAVHHNYPDVRVVMILRDPVSRLWSAFRYRKSLGRLGPEVRFGDFFDECLESYGLGRHHTPEFEHHRTLSEARYAHHLQLWFDTFGDDVRVVFSEQVATTPERVVSDLCGWLGIDVDAAARLEYAPHNVTIEARSRGLEQLARRVNDRADGLFRRAPRLEAVLRQVYARINSAPPSEEMTPADRERVAGFYADANEALRRQLAARGYQRLPAWLDEQVTISG